MKIFNKEKTIELTEVDREKGYLKPDKLVVAHHEATPLVKGKTAREIAEELESQGVIVEEGFGKKLYRVIKEYDGGGRDTELIEDEPDTSAKEAYDEYEDIQTYIPYTAEELKERQLTKLRQQRETECFPIINRGQLWYDTLTEAQKDELKEFYIAWLNVTETLEVPEKPVWLK